MLIVVVLVLLAWVLVSAAIAVPIGRTIARCAPPAPDGCWGCELEGYGHGVRVSPHPDTCCKRAGEWVAESRTRGGRV